MRRPVKALIGLLPLLWALPASGDSGCLPLSVAPAAVPVAVEGNTYTHSIPTYGGKAPIALSVTEGGLPPRMTLAADGTLKGSPSASGTFTFTVTATDSCQPRQQASQRLTIEVLPQGEDASSISGSVVVRPPLKVTVSANPKKHALESTAESTLIVTYELKAEPQATAVLDSPGISFSAAGNVLGSAPVPLSVVLVNGTGVVEESVTLPRKVLEQAQYEGASTLIVSRPFIGRGTTALAVVEVGVPPAQKQRQRENVPAGRR